MIHTTEQIEKYMKDHIKKNRVSSSETPSINLWFRKLANNNYIGGDEYTVCHIDDVYGVTFAKIILKIKE